MTGPQARRSHGVYHFASPPHLPSGTVLNFTAPVWYLSRCDPRTWRGASRKDYRAFTPITSDAPSSKSILRVSFSPACFIQPVISDSV